MFTARTCALLLGLGALAPLALSAQERAIDFGLVGGLNRNTMTGVGPVNAEFAGQAGLYGQFQFSKRVAFRPEMSVSWKRVGTSNSFPIPCDPGLCAVRPEPGSFALEGTTALTWLEVPLLAQVTLPALGGDLVPRLIAGPYVAVRLSCSISSTSNAVYDTPSSVEPSGPQVTVSQSCADASSQSYGNGDAGYVLGAGLAMRHFGVGLRWTRSMVSTVPFNEFGFSPLTGGKQSTLAITVDVAIR